MDGHVLVERLSKEPEDGVFALQFTVHLIGADCFRIAVGEDAVAIIEVRAVPGDAQVVKPGGAELSFKASAEIAFGVRVNVNASHDVHARLFVLVCSSFRTIEVVMYQFSAKGSYTSGE